MYEKLVLLLLVIVSAFSFGANFKPYLKGNTSNPDAKRFFLLLKWKVQKKLLLYIRIEKKVVMFLDQKGKKPEITLEGVIGDNLFFNADDTETLFWKIFSFYK